MKLPIDFRALRERILGWYHGYSERDRRIILGVVSLIGVSIVYVGVVEPILDYRKAAAEEIEQGHESLRRALGHVAKKDAKRAERDDLRKRLAQAKTRLLPGGTGTLGAAALQERANALASEKGISVQSTQVMKEETIEPFRKVGVRLTLSGEIGPLAELVSGLEYAQQLAIPFIEVSRRGAVAGAKGPRTLSVTVEVNGFVQGGVQPKTEAAEGEAVPAEGAPEGAVVAEGQPAVPPAGEAGPTPAEPGAEAPSPADPPPTPGAPPLPAGAPPPPAGPATGGAVAPGAPTTLPAAPIPSITLPKMVFPGPLPEPPGPRASDAHDEDGE